MTWIDRDLAATSPMPIRDAGFGREVRGAVAARRQWLVEQELADDVGGQVRLRINALAVLQRREVLRVADSVSGTLGKPFMETRNGSMIEGRLVRAVDLTSGRFAIVENSREFTLVPWRPVLERQLGQAGAGVMRNDSINWRFGRGRSGPQIS